MSNVNDSGFPSNFSKQLPAAFWAGAGYLPLFFVIFLAGWPWPYVLATALPVGMALIILLKVYREHKLPGKDRLPAVRMFMALLVITVGGAIAGGSVIMLLLYIMFSFGGF